MNYKKGIRRTTASLQKKNGRFRLPGILISTVISVVLTIALRQIAILLLDSGNKFIALPELSYSLLGLCLLFSVVNSFVLFIWFFVKSNFISFYEVSSNWWTLAKSYGIHVSKLINAKLFSSVFSIIFQTVLGFSLTVYAGYLIGFRMTLNYLLVVFFISIADGILIFTVTMAISSFSSGTNIARFFLTLVFFGFHFANYIIGIYDYVLVGGAESLGKIKRLFLLPMPVYPI
ncbi:MAG: hypothetical protein GX928_06755, partial [Ruminococcaceae bacterium]|nr:hypothetical protein [Oscillospiraceae bacterium]